MKSFLALCVVGAVALKQGSLNLLRLPVNSDIDFEDTLVTALRASKGRSSPETKALVDKIQQLLNDAKPSIKKTVEGLQTTLTNAGNSMSDCGGQEMQKSSAAFEKNFSTKSAAHKTCRQTQKQNLDAQNTCQTELKTVTSTAKTTCDALEALEKTMYSAKDSCEVKSGEAFEAYHTRLIEASQKTLAEYKKLKEGCAKAKQELEEKGPECTVALKTYESQKENCDSVQDAMDSLSCSHYEAATSKCEASGTCYDKAVANYESVQTSSMTQLDSLKKEWRAILRMECIIQVFNLEESKRASAIDSCQAKDMSAPATSPQTRLAVQGTCRPTSRACQQTVRPRHVLLLAASSNLAARLAWTSPDSAPRLLATGTSPSTSIRTTATWCPILTPTSGSPPRVSAGPATRWKNVSLGTTRTWRSSTRYRPSSC